MAEIVDTSVSPLLEGKKILFSEIYSGISETYQKLGAGFYGISYLVKFNGSQACLKVGRDPRRVDVFMREAETLASLDGAGGCPKLLACSSTEFPSIVMSFCQGSTIANLEKKNELSVESWLKMYIALSGRLQEIHSLNFVHCDLKGDNVIVDLESDKTDISIIDVGTTLPIGEKIEMMRSNFLGKPATPACDVVFLGRMIKETFRNILSEDVCAWPRGLYLATHMMQAGKGMTLDDVEMSLKKVVAERDFIPSRRLSL